MAYIAMENRELIQININLKTKHYYGKGNNRSFTPYG